MIRFDDPTAYYILALVFLFGVTIGSFLNVCIYRLPEGGDIVKEHSHCMTCGHRLAWYDLIPLFSWLFLGGKCRYCGEKISAQYPLIEAANGLGWVLIFITNDVSVRSLCYCAAFSALLVLSVIDWRTFEIPIGCNIVILIAGIVNLLTDLQNWKEYVIGFASVSALLLLILLVSKGKAMGGGDVKLMAAAGLLLGWPKLIFAFCMGCIIGSVIHLLLMKFAGKGRVLAFGPYLAAGIVLSMLVGNPAIHWYLSSVLGL